MRNRSRFLAALCLILLLLSSCTTAVPPITTAPPDSEPLSTENATLAESTTAPTLPTSNAPSIPDNSAFEIHFLDVGQADCSIILCDGQTMIIDGGNSEDSSMVYTYLKNHGIDYLDYVIATHAHEDHVGGLSGALSYASPGTIYSPVISYDTKAFSNFLKKIAVHGRSISVPQHGDTFWIGSAKCIIIGPTSYSDDPNNISIVLRIEYGSTSFLFTGDAELIEENEILDAGYAIDCDVLKVGHHGSDTSTGYRWLRESSPEYAVISVGRNNSYGHPHENTLSRLRDAEVKVFRTDMQGTIICYSDGHSITFNVERNAEADTLAGAGTGGNHGSDEEPSSGSGQLLYVVNTNSKKFHYPNCSSVNSMSAKNRLDVESSRDELISLGYDPCGRCNP